ncbi:MAG: DUF2239 family protein [bacterium]
MTNHNSCTAFIGNELLARGATLDVALAARKLLDAGEQRAILAFDDCTARPVELDLRGTVEDVRRRYEVPPAPEAPAQPRPRGRPRLGVVGREVTLLPRHWEWLNAQPGGASVALRKLVEQARRQGAGKERVRAAQDAAFRFMSAMAGDAPGYEEAVRALFAGRRDGFEAHTAVWPEGVRAFAERLAEGAFIPDNDPV